MQSGRGGKREGAGRKQKGDSPALGRTIRVNDEDWQQIKDKAKATGLTTTDYIIQKALQD